MASKKEYLDFVLEQLSELEDISYKAMMGEFIIYYRGKIVGGIYDDRLLVKPVKAAVSYMPNAELLIDRAWGWEPTTIADIRAYKPSSNSLSVGQVLHCPYDYEKAKLIVREMIDQHVLDLVDKGLATDQIVLTTETDWWNSNTVT